MQANQEKAQRLHDAGARAYEAQSAVEQAAQQAEEVAAAKAAVAAASAAVQDNAKVPYSYPDLPAQVAGAVEFAHFQLLKKNKPTGCWLQAKARAEKQATELESRADMLNTSGLVSEASAQRAAAGVLLKHAAASEIASAALEHTLCEAEHALVVSECQESALREQVCHTHTPLLYRRLAWNSCLSFDLHPHFCIKHSMLVYLGMCRENVSLTLSHNVNGF